MEKFRLFLLDADYVLDKNEYPVIRLFCKSKEGRDFIVKYRKFRPYFYVLPKPEKENELVEKIKNAKTEGVKEIDAHMTEKKLEREMKKFIVVTINNPRKIPETRKFIKDSFDEVEDTFEYDIPFYKRFLIDFQLRPADWILVKGEKIDEDTIEAEEIQTIEENLPEPKLKMLAFDIEMVEENGKEKIIMISLATNNGFKKVITYQHSDLEYVEVVKDEKTLLKRFVETIRKEDPDVVLGYNSDLFDIPQIKQRCESYKIDLNIGKFREKLKTARRGRETSYKIPGRVYVDLYRFVANILSPQLKSEVLTLDAVANELVGMGKKDLSWQEMSEIWKSKSDITRIVEYNLRDSEITLKLGELLVPQIFAISKLTGLLAFDVSRYAYSQIVENYYMRNAFKENIVVPNRPKYEEIYSRRLEASYKGAIVFEPKTGLAKNIVVMDFRSLYPTIIITHNISPETFNCEHEECKQKNKVPEFNYHFCIKEKGFIPKYLEKVILRRIEIKKKMKQLDKNSEEYKMLNNMQYALKIIANSTYGYMAYVGARWYRKEAAASTTAFERYYIRKIEEMAKKEGWVIIYGDTDSLMVTNPNIEDPEKVKKKALEFLKKVNDSLPGIMELEYRGFYPFGIFVKKKIGSGGAKKRYALLAEDGSLEIRGFETVRRDWCQLAKKVQRDVIEIILRERDVDKAVKYVREVIKMIKNREVNYNDLIIYEQITKPLSEYKQISPHVVAARKMHERGKLVGEGSIIAFVITKRGSSISEKAEPAEDATIEDIDTDYYIKNQIIPAATRVLSAFNITESELLSGVKQVGLHKFFKKN